METEVPLFLVRVEPFILDGERIALRAGTMVVGRTQDCAISLPDSSVSRRHAELTIRGAIVSVRDLGSQNGTYIDEARIDWMRLNLGQTIRFGRIAFALQSEKTLPSVLPPDALSTMNYQARSPETVAALNALTPALTRVLELMLDGKSEKQIAAQLGISPHTAHNHVRALYRNFGAHSRVDLYAKLMPQRDMQSDTTRLNRKRMRDSDRL